MNPCIDCGEFHRETHVYTGERHEYSVAVEVYFTCTNGKHNFKRLGGYGRFEESPKTLRWSQGGAQMKADIMVLQMPLLH